MRLSDGESDADMLISQLPVAAVDIPTYPRLPPPRSHPAPAPTPTPTNQPSARLEKAQRKLERQKEKTQEYKEKAADKVRDLDLPSRMEMNESPIDRPLSSVCCCQPSPALSPLPASWACAFASLARPRRSI